MTSSEAKADVFLTALRALPKVERDAVLRGIVEDKRLRRDLVDLAIIAERRAEPSIPFRQYLAERNG